MISVPLPLSVIILFCLALPGWTNTVNADPLVEGRLPKTLVYARISSDPRDDYPPLKRMVEYVSANLRADGIEQGEALVTKDAAQLIEWVRTGRVDWVTGTPLAALALRQQANAQWFLRRWKNGVTEYRTLFIVRNTSPFQALADLRGRRIAMEAPHSTSGFLLPMAALVQGGQEPTPLAALSDPLPTDKIGYWFSGSAHHTAARVVKGDADAGAISDQDWQEESEMPALLRNQLRIMHQTDPVPRAVEMVRPGLPATLQNHLQAQLLHLHEDPQARNILQDFDKTARFDLITEPTLQALEHLGTLAQQLQAARRVERP